MERQTFLSLSSQIKNSTLCSCFEVSALSTVSFSVVGYVDGKPLEQN